VPTRVLNKNSWVPMRIIQSRNQAQNSGKKLNCQGQSGQVKIFNLKNVDDQLVMKIETRYFYKKLGNQMF
jgi:hypothetical protein